MHAAEDVAHSTMDSFDRVALSLDRPNIAPAAAGRNTITRNTAAIDDSELHTIDIAPIIRPTRPRMTVPF